MNYLLLITTYYIVFILYALFIIGVGFISSSLITAIIITIN